MPPGTKSVPQHIAIIRDGNGRWAKAQGLARIKGHIDKGMIDVAMFSKHLYTRYYPDPDLLIRTSGEMRLSNFLLWQLSYTEMYVTQKLWPDFTKKDLFAAVEEYGRRQRRYGAVE